MGKIRLYPSIPSERSKKKEESSRLKASFFEENYKLVYLTVFLFFTAAILCTNYGFRTMISIPSFFRILILFIFLSWLIQITLFRTIFPMKKMEYLMVSSIGVAPMLTATFLILNFYIHRSEKKLVVKISEIEYKSPYQYFHAEGIPCDTYPELCAVYEDDLALSYGMKVEVTIAKGIGGFEVLSDVKTAN